MRILQIFFIFLLTKSIAFADCTDSGIYVWPKTNTISQNSIIAIECYASSLFLIEDIKKGNPIFLVSGKNKIQLSVLEITIGEFLLTKVILKPEKNLSEGAEYFLQLGNKEKANKDLFTKWNNKTFTYERITWRVEGIDNEKPVWLTKPSEVNKSYNKYGCGPAVNVMFNFKVKEKNSFLVRTTVTEISTKKATTYYIELRDSNSIYVGHGMCSGAFLLEGDKFEVTFDLIDASGNLTKWEGEPITFIPPTYEVIKE